MNYFVPLTERMFDLQTTAEAEGRQSEAKVWSVLVEQIWMGLPGYCWGTVDLKQARNYSSAFVIMLTICCSLSPPNSLSSSPSYSMASLPSVLRYYVR